MTVFDPIRRRLLDTLYTEAMLLADEARSYFDEDGRAEREALDPLVRVGFSCESLKVTTRLMHVIAWLLTHRAVVSGELGSDEALEPSRRLGEAPVFDADLVRALPRRAQALIAASTDLHRRVAQLDVIQDTAPVPFSPVHSMHEQLKRGFG